MAVVGQWYWYHQKTAMGMAGLVSLFILFMAKPVDGEQTCPEQIASLNIIESSSSSVVKR
ncbi:hypothetical protein GCM10023116_50740 [Kistimonas scapharcae]|uniref:Uncharacterized protein n=1 Tax=Kistimonas scapharcae TaxID=1036133 RepID=A0ABP8VCS7_9GAMM